VEHQLVGAGVAIAASQLDDVAHVAVVAKAHALDHAPVAHVQTGNQPYRDHLLTSLSATRFSSRARPTIQPATPAGATSARSWADPMPPEACTSSDGKR